MLARVLFVLLAGVPVCRGTKGVKGAAYSAYYDADGDVQNADFYDSYDDEIKSPQKMTTVMEPTTRLKRRNLDDVRTLNPEEIIDVKGVLNNILQGKKPESVRGRRTARDYSDSYDYIENSVDVGPDTKTDKKLVPPKWQPTVAVQKGSTTAADQEYLDDSSSHATEQHWSFVYQPDTSTAGNNDIIAEVKKMTPVRDGDVPSRSSVDYWRPTQEVQTWGSTEATEETEDTLIYPLESTTYSNSDMQAEVRKLVQHWSASSTDNIVQESTTTYSNSDMQAEVRKLVQHWSASSSVNQETSSYNNAAMRADVKQLIQNWSLRDNVQYQSPSSNVQQESHRSSVQHRGPSMAKEEMNQQKTGMQTELKKLQPWNPILEYKDWSAPANVQHLIHSENVQHWSATDNVHHQTPSDNVQHWSAPDNVQHWSSSDNSQQWSSSNNDQHWSAYSNVQHRILTDNVKNQNLSMNVQYWNPSMNVQQQDPSDNVQHQKPSINVQHQNPPMNVQYQDLSMNVHHWSPSDNVQHRNASVNIQHWSPTIDVHQWNPIAANNQENLPFTVSKTDPSSSNATDMDTVGDTPRMLRGPESTTTPEPNDTTTLQPTTTTTITTAKLTTTTQKMDIDAIMAIISNLTYDYEWNLTEQFNKTIIEHGVPTCPWEKWGPGGAWTATTSGTTLFPWDFENTSVVSKCFVCGLRTPEIPRNAFCADAFAGDFLPLMPIDPQSRGKIAGFRKYCRYIDTQNYVENPDEPRAIYGRFTGGCAVRWTDITGVYTQRTCRSKFRPLMGKHFASKRMAKLELALVNVENGCIISPMATLLPVSRGISLYARFHACVCSTNWCNRATIEQASFNTLVTILLACWLVHYP